MCLDFSSVDLFWPVADELSRGTEPDQKVWSSLFETPAYLALTASEFSVDFFKQCWRLAYSPHPCSEPPPPRRLRFVRHYRQVLEKKGELVQFLDKLGRCPDLYDRAVKMALHHLPPGDYADGPRVAFAVFDMDGRGYRPIVIDPLSAMTSGEQLVSFLAHEFHHHYVCQLTGLQLGTADDRTDLQWVVDQIHLEGLANMVNMDAQFEGGTCPPSFAEEVRKSPQFLFFMDAGLRALRTNPGEAESIGKKIRGRLASSGHPVGYHMARMIRDRLGKTRLLETTDDPLRFFRAFSEAEAAAGLCRTLTPGALDALEGVR